MSIPAVRALRALALAAIALAAAAAGARAQIPDPELSRIDTLLAASRFTEARGALQRWLAASAGRQAQGNAAHALMLRARLAAAADSALPLYLELALNHPADRFAPAALLRLGQGYTATGEYERAEGYLERLLRDYPGFDQRATAMLWLGRAQRARRRTADACTTFRQALAATNVPDDVRRILADERDRCSEDSATDRPDSSNPFTIQIGAFRELAGARDLVARLRARDIDARIVHVGSGTLLLVRAGRFPKSADASALLRRVRAIVPDAVIASDATRERSTTQ